MLGPLDCAKGSGELGRESHHVACRLGRGWVGWGVGVVLHGPWMDTVHTNCMRRVRVTEKEPVEVERAR